jgi:2,3-bisphosphoglycerate-dependent phosphoglycerate mutase
MRSERDAGRGRGRLVALRHGRSEWNVTGRFTGSVDVGLSLDGRREARAAARALIETGIDPDLVVTSSLQRTIETGAILVDGCGWTGMRVVSTADLDERGHGVLEGLTRGEAEERFGVAAVRSWRRSAHAGPPSGESFGDDVVRVRRAWSAIVLPALGAGQDVVVVAHGTSMRALLVVAGALPTARAARTEVETAQPIAMDWSAAGTLVATD